MDHQLRTYTLEPGKLDAFVALFRDHLVAARAAYGFEVVGAWTNSEQGTFVWVVRHPGDFAAADKAYYDSPERAALPTDPATLLAKVETRMLEAVLL